MELSRRNFVISLLVTACILLPGSLLLRDSETAVQANAVVSFVIGLSLLLFLDERERKRRRGPD
jgi:hypothetical protein